MAGSEKLGFKVKSVSHFLKHLKELGERLLPVFKKKVRYEMNQFVAAAIVSRKEIENEDISIIYEANRKLDVACEYLSDSCFSFNRLVVLMNTTKPARHGEARLFDPDVKIRKEILGIRAIGLMDDNNTNFLDNLKSMFANDFETKRLSYIMCIFSHNIPCTEQSHQCAQIIDEFARKQNTEVIIGYEEVYFKTKEKDALQIMNSNDRIVCLKLKKSSSPPSNTKSSSQSGAYTGTRSKIQGVTDSRSAKQARKRRKLPSPSIPSEKKKPKSYDREKPEEN